MLNQVKTKLNLDGKTNYHNPNHVNESESESGGEVIPETEPDEGTTMETIFGEFLGPSPPQVVVNPPPPVAPIPRLTPPLSSGNEDNLKKK